MIEHPQPKELMTQEYNTIQIVSHKYYVSYKPLRTSEHTLLLVLAQVAMQQLLHTSNQGLFISCTQSTCHQQKPSSFCN